jgi:APA family basic amino acid/polyamine antiporter
VTTWLTGIVVALFSMVANIDEVVQLTNIGTLFAFVLVCAGVTVLRFKEPERARPFRVPFGPWVVPGLGALSCLFLMFWLPPASWWRFIGWLALGMAAYSGYGFAHSALGRGLGRPAATPWTMRLAALGFLAAALGLFVLPHDLALSELLAGRAGAEAAVETRRLSGLALVAGGLATAVAGWWLAARHRPAAEAGRP